MVPDRSHNADGMLVFGGVSLDSYCKSRLHRFQVLNYGTTPEEERHCCHSSSSPAATGGTFAGDSAQRRQAALQQLLAIRASPTKAKKDQDTGAFLGAGLGDLEDEEEAEEGMTGGAQRLQVL